MGMTIEEIIEELEDSKDYPASDPASDEALDGAIEIMRKYQKIEEIVEHWAYCGNPSDSMIAISEVLDNGNDD